MTVSSMFSNTVTPANELQEGALKCAEKGWKVFPLRPRGKEPATRHGFKDATTDSQQIREWWQENPDFNIGIATGDGLVVLDADSPDAVLALSGLPATRTATTSKGKHFYFASDKTFKNSVSKVREKVDVRGDGGYVVAPPSIHPDGTQYKWENEDVSVAALPKELETGLEESANPERESAPEKADLSFLEGQRNDGLTRLAGDLIRRVVQAGLSLDEMKALLRYRNEQTCLPPLPQAEVDAITTSVYRAEQKKRPDRKISFLSLADIERLPDPEFLIDTFLVKNSLAILYGNPKVGKTFLALDMALRVASGQSWFGHSVLPAPVVYVCAEGLQGMKPRIRANRSANNVVTEPNLTFVGRAVQLHQPASVDDFIASVHERNLHPSLVIFDTLSRCTVGVDENTAKDMNQVIAGLERIKREFEATVMVLHHPKKSDPATIRGSGVLLGAVDTALSLVAKGQERVLCVEDQKESEGGKTLTFELQNVSEFKSAVPVLVTTRKREPSLSGNAEKALSVLSNLGSEKYTGWMNASGLKKHAFNDCREELVKKGLVQKSDDGKYGPIAEPS